MRIKKPRVDDIHRISEHQRLVVYLTRDEAAILDELCCEEETRENALVRIACLRRDLGDGDGAGARTQAS